MDTLETAKKRFQTAKEGWSDVNLKAKADLEFLSDNDYAQCDPTFIANRTAGNLNRPVVEIDQLSQYIHQVTNDIRRNTPTIHVIPDGNGSEIDTAEAMQGRIKAIEYKSNADAAYDMAADFAVKSSIGYIRVDHGYKDDEGFEQELQIKRVVNPQAILIDPMSIEPDGSDAKYGFALEEITVEEFKIRYPKATPMSFGDEKPRSDLKDTETLTIAEYFYIEDGEEELGLLEDGKTEKATKDKKYKSTRRVKRPKVMRQWLGGEDELTKPSKFPGKYIPLVPVYGEECWIEGKRHLLSLIRKAKSPAMAYNELKATEMEILSKQLHAPVQAAVGQMRGFENDWKTPEKAMVLYYHTTDATGKDVNPPQRLQPPTISQGYAQASLDAESNIKKSLGMYSASVGNREGDSSGVALKQLEQSSDLATLHFGDNLIRSITHVGKILVCALPEIEDTKRLVQTISNEDEMKQIGINGMRAEGQDKDYHWNKGTWDVRVIAGASFTTQRQEAAAHYADLVSRMPDLMPVIGDLVFKYQDVPGAQAISSRLKKLVDPKLLDESERDKDEADPRLKQVTDEATQIMEVAKQEIAQLQQQLQQMQQELQAAKSDIQSKMADSQLKAAELPLKQKELELKEKEIDLKAVELQQKGEIEREKTAADLTKTRIEAKQANMSPDIALSDPDFHEGPPPMAGMMSQLSNAIIQQSENMSAGLQLIAQNSQSSTDALIRALNKPKEVIYDDQGNPRGIQ